MLQQDMRKKALRRALADINAEIELCAQKNIPVWSPMGNRNQRVLRLVADDAIILNSREKVDTALKLEKSVHILRRKSSLMFFFRFRSCCALKC